MSKLTDYRMLSFDVYGTLIDWETGVVQGLDPILSKVPNQSYTRKHLLERYHHFEAAQQKATPSLRYSELLAKLLPNLAMDLGLPSPSSDECRKFGDSVGSWPAFPDTVDALEKLGKTYKLVVLSNVDRDSFSNTNVGPLGGVKLDAILTAEDIGTYKPDLRNFEYMIDFANREWGIGKDQILQTAQSQFHDHHPAREMGLKSVWIVRPGAEMGNTAQAIWDWKFDTLGEMAEEVEKT